MNRSLVALWLAIIASVLTLVLLAQFWISQRSRNAQQRVSELLASQLAPFDQAIERVIDGYALEFERASAATDISNPANCVELRRNPLVRSLVVIDQQERTLVYPDDLRNATLEERTLVIEAQQILRDHFPRTITPPILNSPPQQLAISAPQFRITPDSDSSSISIEQAKNWVTWYHGRGLVLGYAWQLQARWQAIIVLPRARWLADIVAALPDADQTPSDATSRPNTLATPGSLQQLVDVEGKVLHQWSTLPLAEWSALTMQLPHAEIPVTSPLDGWRLRQIATEDYRRALAGDELNLPIWMAVAGMAIALVLAGTLVTLNIRRELRLAQQRVSFVNQVSHELRTPLTNICMYADLIAQSFDDSSDSAEQLQQQERISVIRGESQRLTRLINNVLEFARPAPRNNELQRQPENLDAIVAETLATFEPKLKELGFRVECEFMAPGLRLMNRDAVEQILVNLIGNAEKYAACGKYLRVTTAATGDRIHVSVVDHGPGIPPSMRERIFKAFVRLADRLEDPAGTGIGLTIARELARKHGGDCILLESKQGAAFQLTLDAPNC
jgi:signal transduction histidine kinase